MGLPKITVVTNSAMNSMAVFVDEEPVYGNDPYYINAADLIDSVLSEMGVDGIVIDARANGRPHEYFSGGEYDGH